MANSLIKKNKQKKQNSTSKIFMRRCFVLVFIFLAFSVAVILQLKKLQIDEGGDWQLLADNQQLRNVTIKPERGVIYDAKGRTMAQSTAVWTIEASPNVMAESKLNKDKTLDQNAARVAANVLAPILGFDEAEKETLYNNFSDTEKKYYKVKGQVDQETADAIRQACKDYYIKGIYIIEDTKRVYPYQELAATVLGFVGDADEGREGIEYQYNEVLAGVPGRQILPVNALGTEMPSDADHPYYPAEDGRSIVLTIDVDVQQVLEKHLKLAVERHDVQNRGMGLVMDVNTGAILGMAVYPAFNPNEPFEIIDERQLAKLDEINDKDEYVSEQGKIRAEQWRNKILSDTYEPGSVFKIVTAAAAFDSGTYNENIGFACTGGIMVDGWDDPIKCALGITHGNLTIQQALIKSCNECFVRISSGLGVNTWYDYANAFGMTEPTGIDLPGEPSQNSLNVVTYRQEAMKAIDLAVCSFGQGNKYTALQMAMAASAAVNGGNLMQPYVVQQILDSNGNVVEEIEPVLKRQVISENTSVLLRNAMEEMVATENTGQMSYLTGYHIGGKSGTSQKLELKQQEGREEYIASFYGFAPANDPQVAVFIILDEPQDSSATPIYFGGRLAGPVVRDIFKDIMPILGIEPDYASNQELLRSTVSVPQVVEQATMNAKTKLSVGNLNYHVIGEGSTVYGQFPEAGSTLNYGGEVYLYTDASIGMEYAAVPDVMGLTPQNAASQLKNAGFNVLTAGEADNTLGVIVVGQDIPAGTELQKGSMITVTIAEG